MTRTTSRIFNIVLGTAGHIDHGKSSLVERLTGVDPDRLPEEKARGLTIDLGFAPLPLPDGRKVGIVDVPGHERLIKNMVAGATGIDAVLLVVAADDGVMPQTREHLTILRILGIRAGLVAVTKIDLVDEEMLELVREEIAETVEGTFLADAPIVEVSSVTGEGIDRLLDALVNCFESIEPRDASGMFRMPIQRVFSPKGFGTVVTGIPVRGTVRLGDTLEIVPLGQKGRVRGLQAYKEPAEVARAGHSTAINLSDIAYHDVHRGMVVAEPGYLEAATMYEARLDYLPTSRRPLAHQTRVRLHVGTAEVLGRIHLLESRSLAPGESSFVQFRLDEPVAAVPGDRYVVRLHSPMETIGGGEILGISTHRLKSGKSFVVERLRKEEAALADRREHIRFLLEQAGYATQTVRELAIRSGQLESDVKETLDELIADGLVQPAQKPGQLFLVATLERALTDAETYANEIYAENPLSILVEKASIARRLRASDAFFEEILRELERRGIASSPGAHHLRFRDREPRLDERDRKIRDAILSRTKASPFQPPSPDEISEALRAPADRVQAIYDLLGEEGEIVRVAEGIWFHREAIEEAKRRLRRYLEEHGSVTASDAKSILDSTRKYSIPFLEHLDREGFTVRKGDVRVLRAAPPGS